MTSVPVERGDAQLWAACLASVLVAWPPFMHERKGPFVNGTSLRSSRVRSLNLASVSVLTVVLSMFPTTMALAESTSAVVSGTATASPTSNTASEGHSSTDVSKLVESGVDQMHRNDLVGASRTFKQVLKADPGNKYAWYNLGVIAHQSNQLTSARRAYEKALKADPTFGPALFNEAVLVRSSDPDRAIALLKRAVASNPKASTAYFLLGEILAKKGSKSEAKDAFARAVAIDPQLRPQVPAGFLE